MLSSYMSFTTFGFIVSISERIEDLNVEYLEEKSLCFGFHFSKNFMMERGLSVFTNGSAELQIRFLTIVGFTDVFIPTLCKISRSPSDIGLSIDNASMLVNEHV